MICVRDFEDFENIIFLMLERGSNKTEVLNNCIDILDRFKGVTNENITTIHSTK